MGREDFLIAPCNAESFAWIDRWPDWSAPVLILQGPPACGKTHMGYVWMQRSGSRLVEARNLEQLPADRIFLQQTPLLIDHLDPWVGSRQAETTLFHIYNMLQEHGMSALITMRMSPEHADFAVPDLASRIRSCPVARIKMPDETLLGSLLIKMFQDRQLKPDQNLIKYILPRAERSFAAMRDIVERADALALAKKRPLSIPLMREVLAEQELPGKGGQDEAEKKGKYV